MWNDNVASIQLTEAIDDKTRVVSAWRLGGKLDKFMVMTTERNKNGESKDVRRLIAASKKAMFKLVEGEVDWSARVDAQVKEYIFDDFDATLGKAVRDNGGTVRRISVAGSRGRQYE